MRYLILQLYWEHGIIMLVFIQAATVDNCRQRLSQRCQLRFAKAPCHSNPWLGIPSLIMGVSDPHIGPIQVYAYKRARYFRIVEVSSRLTKQPKQQALYKNRQGSGSGKVEANGWPETAKDQGRPKTKEDQRRPKTKEGQRRKKPKLTTYMHIHVHIHVYICI